MSNISFLSKNKIKTIRFLIFLSVFFVTFCVVQEVSAASSVYYSVGQNTTDHKTGTPTVTVSGTTATFSVVQTVADMGVGDVITYTGGVCYISGKTSTTVWSCTNATGGTPPAVTNASVTSIAHAFNSLSAAEAGAPTLLGSSDLTTLDVQLNFPCYYDSGADTTAVTIDGYTTDATRYIKIYTPGNASAEVNQRQRHNGKWDDNQYHLTVSGTALYNYEDYIWIEGLQIEVNGSGDSDDGISVSSGAIETKISSCIIKESATASQAGISVSSGGGNLKAWNNIIYGFDDYGIRFINATGTAYLYSNTIRDIVLYDNSSGIFQSSGTVIAKNNIVQNCGDNNGDNYVGSFTSSDYNISRDATAPGANSKTGTTVSFIDITNKDFHLSLDDTAAKNAGVDLSADINLSFNTDIDSATRTSVSIWDIGADEIATQIYRSAGPGVTGILESDSSHARNITITSGVATFSDALADNIGVGDAVLIDTNSDNSITSADTILFISGRSSSTSYQLQANDGAIPSNISINDTYQIFRAHTSLSLAEAGTKNTSIPITFNGGDRDLIVNNEQWNIACYANGTTADTTVVAISGWHTGPHNLVRVYTPTTINEVGISQRHSGKWDDIKYKLEVNTTWVVLSISSQYAIIDGLQVNITGADGSVNGISSRGADSEVDVVISNCVVKNSNTNNTFANFDANENDYATVVFYNNVSYSISGNNAGFSSNKAVSYMYNNIAYNNSTGFSRGGGTPTLYNNIAYNCGNDFSGPVTGDYNITNDQSPFWIPGANYISGTTNSTLTNKVINSSATFIASGVKVGSLIKNTTDNTYTYITALDSETQLSVANDIFISGEGYSISNNRYSTVSFVDEVNKDFHLAQSDTFARQSGVNLTNDINVPAFVRMTTDIDGQLRNPIGAGWDIGVDEGTVEFTPTVMQTGGDYSTLSSWEAGVQTDLVASTTRVFAHGGITGTIADNATVTGVTSGSTATVVHATTNQILLENISGTFQSGETVQVTAGNSVVISDNGNPASAVAKIDGAWSVADTTAVTIDGWNTGADNYIKVYTISAARHQGKRDDNRYRLSISTSSSSFYVLEDNFRVDGVQVYMSYNSGDTSHFYVGTSGGVQELYISNNVFRGLGTYNDGYIHDGISKNGSNASFGSKIKIWNNIFYDFAGSSLTGRGVYSGSDANKTFYAYNNTFYNIDDSAIYVNAPVLARNNIAQNIGGSAYAGSTFSSGSNYNISDDTTAPGSNSKINAQVKFISTTAGNEDFHLASDDKSAKDFGTSLASDSALAFSTDIDGQTRTGTWDIGADETATEIYRSVGPGKVDTLDNDASHTKNVTLSGGVATFSAALPDNIGVGDVVIIDTAGTADTIDSTDTLLFIHKRNSSTSYNLRTQTGAVPANITSNDTYAIYRAYTSLANAEAGTINSTLSAMSFPAFTGGNRDLVANNEQWNITCYANGTTADTTAVIIEDWNTGVQNFIKVYTPVYNNEVGVIQRHSGKWDGNKYSLISNTYSTSLQVISSYVQIDGLQIKIIPNSSYGNIYALHISPESSYTSISNSIVIVEDSYTNNTHGITLSSNTGNVYVWNNIVYGINLDDGFYSIQGGQTVYLFNNAVHGVANGFNRSDGLVVLKNNIAQNCTNGYNGTFDATSDYNISDLAADAPGANSKNSTTVNFIDTANKNFCLSSDDTAAKGAGINLSTDTNLSFTDDIRGQSRPASPTAWSIGACETLAAQKTKMEGTTVKMEGNVKME